MQTAIDPELVVAAFLAPLTDTPVAAVLTAPSTSTLPQHVVEVLSVETLPGAPHGLLWSISFQVTTVAKTAGAAFQLAGTLQDALLAAVEEAALADGLRVSEADVDEHPLRTGTDKAASTVVAAYTITVSTPNPTD